MSRLRSVPSAGALALLLCASFFVHDAVPQARAQSQQDLQAQVDSTSQQIKQLQDEIAKLESQLTTTTAQKQTLQTTVHGLDLQIQKLQTSLALTQKQISQKDSDIKKLGNTIVTTQDQIGQSQTEVADSLRELDHMGDDAMVTALLGGGTLASFFDEAVSIAALRSDLQNRIDDLSALKTNLTTSKQTAEQKRQQLAALQSNLSDQKNGISAARATQNSLLVQTKNQESTYQALIAQKKAQEQQFENDLLTYQAKLGLSVAVGSLPGAQNGVLSWPVPSPRITQYFGNTPFSTANPQIYNGHGHTGLDLAASVGTPIKAALNGVVLGTGNTDLTCPNASYGKWVFVKHPNGLSTLYAHLSQILVSQGQSVVTGQTVGLSGQTGYATGPHLHFGVYASSGSEISSFPSASCPGHIYTMPVGDLSAYLNPLSYLPAI
jgi:murein DD-endopeptidase MepM/ murein hydrolase activator NlpD